ncbi:minor capsid protein [Capybara microvirus Cap1_SP_192]|nr:minor capsid protein [Capybara microvirus Cap1_SP_192]
MIFPTKYNRAVCEPSNSGSRFRPVYSGEFDDFGVFNLKKTSEVDLFEEIQAYADSVDLDLILAQFAAGNEEVFNRVQGFYADVSDMPNSYAEMLNTIQSSKEFFVSLPAEVKEKFNNDFGEFMVASESPDFLSNFLVTPFESANVDSSPANDVSSVEGGCDE